METQEDFERKSKRGIYMGSILSNLGLGNVRENMKLSEQIRKLSISHKEKIN
jgi:hypothetical protein